MAVDTVDYQIRDQPINEHSNYSDYTHLENPSILKKNFVFGILVILQQIIVCFIYGFLYQQPPRQIISATDFPSNYAPIFSAFSMYMFVLVGFGLLFSYNKRLVFSGIGFTLLITLLTVEWYFLFNAFWTKANLYFQGTDFKYSNRFYMIYLANRDGPETVSPGAAAFVQRHNAALTDAVRCGLANSIAFSAILGRAGLLEAFFVSLIGTIGYELNRNIIEGIGFDYGHTFKIFVYGGFFGLILGLLLRIKENTPERSTERHLRYTGTLYSGAMALVGTVFTWVFFPMIVMDPPQSTQPISTHAIYTAPISIMYGLAGSTVVCVGFSYFINAKLMVRDVIYGTIAGGIAVSSASYYITNPVWAMLVGSVAGIIQAIGNAIEKKHSRNGKIVNTISFILFGVQGIVGSAWASIWRAVIITRRDGLNFNLSALPSPVLDFASAWVSAALGIGFGLIAGIFVFCLARHERADHFDDYTYWEKDDGLRYPSGGPVAPVMVDTQIGVKQFRSSIKQRHAYL